jgi:L-ascorbate metabolism protein UlaG (beta-lactamase superfamily)
MIPIGAYEPRWFMGEQHIDPEEAVRVFQLCGAQRAIGHHWGTFQLTDEPIFEPEQRLHAAAQFEVEGFGIKGQGSGVHGVLMGWRRHCAEIVPG